MLVQAGGIKADSSPRLLFSPGSKDFEHLVQTANIGVQPAAENLLADQEVVEIDLTPLHEGRSVPELELPVRGGVTILVRDGGTVVVDGWVETPGPYPLRPGMTARQAIDKAGGLHF